MSIIDRIAHPRRDLSSIRSRVISLWVVFIFSCSFFYRCLHYIGPVTHILFVSDMGDIPSRSLVDAHLNETTIVRENSTVEVVEAYHHRHHAINRSSTHSLNVADVSAVSGKSDYHTPSRYGDHRNRILQIIRDFEAYPGDLIWQSVDAISINEPFIFFHQRTAGGSSIRKSLLDTSQSLNLSHFIICYSPAKLCDQYHFPKQPPYAVYAGHFQWNYLMDLNRLHHSNLKFSCMTNFREPVRRFPLIMYLAVV